MKKTLLPKIMDLLLDTVCVVDEEGRYVFISASCEALLGYTPGELLGRNMIELVHPEDRERTLAAAADIMSGRPRTHFENRYIRKDGRVVEIMWSARWLEADRLRLAVARDVTALKRAARIQAALYRISEAAHAAEGLPTLCEHVHRIVGELLPAGDFCVALYDSKQRAVTFPYRVGDARPQDESLRLDAGTPVARVIESGKPLLATAVPGAVSYDWLGVPLISDRGDVMGALVVRHRNDTPGYTEEDGELLAFVSTQIAAAIERKQSEARLRYMAAHDALTGLPNRSLFQDRLEVALSRARRDKERLGLLYLDLDGFKHVNDTHGHETGDRLLCAVARRLEGCVRESDTVARLGGDEFTVLLTNIRGAAGLKRVIEKVRDAFKPSFEANGHILTVSASIGSALYPDQGADHDQLFRQADAEMYADKKG